MTELQALAARMKANAEETLCDPRDVAAALAEGRLLAFPEKLKGFMAFDGVMHQLQFSHDRLSEGKTLIHLSCGREDQAPVTEAVKAQLREVFFGDEETFEFPGNEMIGRAFVAHIAALRVKT